MHSEKWIAKSLKFKELASRSLEEKSYDFASFFAQQAVEFYLKGMLVQRAGVKSYSHSLTVLIESLIEAGVAVPRDVRDCTRKLGEHYLQALYADARITDYREDEAKEALRCMEVTLDFLTSVR